MGYARSHTCAERSLRWGCFFIATGGKVPYYRPVSRKCPSCGTVYDDATFFCGNDGKITIQEQAPGDIDHRLGLEMGEYIVVARVADGAMGRVYEGRHRESKTRVAIKILHDAVAKDPVAVERFKREYETAAEFEHPNIVKVVDYGETGDGSWFMTMEYLEGEELGAAIRRDGAMSLGRIVRIVCQAADALDYAHSFGVIHRDLKPDNIFLCRGDEGDSVRLLDFGSVKLQMETGPKLTAFGTTLGSPYYMSPEQAMGKQDIDQRSDVFALAAIVFEMLTGKIAFDGGAVAEILMKIVNGQPPAPSAVHGAVPNTLDPVIEKGLRKDKTRRFASSADLAKALFEALGLTGEVVDWGRKPLAEVETAVGAASPVAPALSVPPPSAAAASPAVAIGGPKAFSAGSASANAVGSDEDALAAAGLAPKAGPPSWLLGAVVVTSIAVIGLIAVLLMR